jgi:hypothetical protein
VYPWRGGGGGGRRRRGGGSGGLRRSGGGGQSVGSRTNGGRQVQFEGAGERIGFHIHGPGQNFAGQTNFTRANQHLGGNPNNFGAVSGVLSGAHICLASDYKML